MVDDRLRIEDFVAQTDGVTLDDLPPAARSRLNNELADLTGGGDDGSYDRDTDGILVSKNLDGRTGFETIADALARQNLQNAGDGRATPPVEDAAILVEPGTYSGDDNNQLTLETAGLTLLGREGPTETAVESQVIVEADNVTVAGLSVSPPDPGDTEGTDEAIRVDGGADGVTIADNVVKDFARNSGAGFTGIDGINIFGGDGDDPIENATVRNNTVQRLQNTGAEGTEFPGGTAGISVQGNVQKSTIRNNTVNQIGQEVTNFGFGIVVRGTGNNNQTPTAIAIENNDIDSVLSDPESPTVGVGIGLEAGSADDVTFTGNDISNTEFLLEDKTATVDLNSFASSNTLDRGALLEKGDFGDATRNVIFDSIQFALNFATPDSTLDAVSGTYDEQVSIDTDNLTLSGAGQGETVIDASGNDGRGIEVNSPGVTLREFTVIGTDESSEGSYGVKIQPFGPEGGLPGKSATVDSITVKGSYKTELDLIGVQDGTVSNVVLNGQNTRGVGLALSNCKDVSLENVETRDNNWGGIGLFTNNQFSSVKLANITISNHAAANGESVAPIYLDPETENYDLPSLVPSYQYKITSEGFRDGDFQWFFETQSAANAYKNVLESDASVNKR